VTVLIGVPLRPLVGHESPPKLALNRTYFEAIENAGAVALPIPILRDPQRLRRLYELVDGLLLPGGADVEPRRYGAVAREDCHLSVDPELDEVELHLTEWALADGLPLLAVCRGIQVLNVACGGTLWQDLQVEGAAHKSHYQEPRDLLFHELDVDADSLLARTMGTTHVGVNSLHHQAIRDLGGSLRAVAHSSDGLVEGVELPSHDFVLGIQCHPEELSNTEPWAARLFTGLVAAAKERSGVRDSVFEQATKTEPT
jgi:putative glutamine amidotransferase